MPEIKNLTDKNGNIIYPRTNVDAVVINENKNLTEELNKIIENIKIKQKVYHQPWYRGELDENGDRTIPNSDEIVLAKLMPVKEWYLDGITMPIHINYSNINNEFYIEGGGIDNLKRIILLCNENQIKIRALKFHQSYSSSVITNLGDNFKIIIKEFIVNICTQLKYANIEYCTIWNESEYYCKEENEEFFLDLIETIQNLGYKTSISCAGFYFTGGFAYLPESIRQKVDFIGANLYVRIGTKYENTSIEDSISAWKTHELWLWADIIKNQYKKPLILTESGIQDWWQCLSQPSNSVWSNATISNGMTEYLYYLGMFKTLKDNDLVSEIWQWYDFNYEILKPLFLKYLGDEK